MKIQAIKTKDRYFLKATASIQGKRSEVANALKFWPTAEEMEAFAVLARLSMSRAMREET